jgi:hypothetical protein
MFVGILGLFLVTNNLTKNSIELTKNCTWGDLKMCYSGRPVANNPCCQPKVADDPIAKDCTWTELKLCYMVPPVHNQCCPEKYHMDNPV